MSFFREDFVTPLGVARKNRYPAGVRIARIRARDLLLLELDPTPNPLTEELPGHIVVPKLSWIDKKTPAQKEQFDTWEVRLAELATEYGVLNPLNLSDPRKQ